MSRDLEVLRLENLAAMKCFELAWWEGSKAAKSPTFKHSACYKLHNIELRPYDAAPDNRCMAL